MKKIFSGERAKDQWKIRFRLLGIYFNPDNEKPQFSDGSPADYAIYSARTANISYSFNAPCIALVEIGINCFFFL